MSGIKITDCSIKQLKPSKVYNIAGLYYTAILFTMDGLLRGGLMRREVSDWRGPVTEGAQC